MGKEDVNIYLVLLGLAYVAFNVGMFIFCAQHATKDFGPDKGSLDPIYFAGMVVFTLCPLAAIAFVVFRLRGK